MARGAAVSMGSYAQGRLEVCIHGRWRIQGERPRVDELLSQLTEAGSPQQVVLNAESLETWDSSLLIYIKTLDESLKQRGIDVDAQRLPGGVKQLLALEAAVPPKKGVDKSSGRVSMLARVGQYAVDEVRSIPEWLSFVGESAFGLLRMLAGKARFRRSDFALILQECGPQALPVVTLISFLVGLILAYVGSVQLRQFGAQIFVADLVALSMVRVMGALMTGVIMAGRTGAGFAAQLGTMQVNEEIDAFRTMGIKPMEFLVLPRMLALILMVPLLTLYANLVGILAGMLVGVTMLDLGAVEYYQQTINALNLNQFVVGLTQAAVFGVLIALAGCLRGIQCGRSAAAVGSATTSAVVTSIILIVVAAGILTIVFNELGI